ncbi:fimbria/pilus outer membrane usher protein [Serratia ficaria]|uniref:fimbria/pilus outer membrane usher protein n=1 Tax=Serratia ficaria TaxID=61651 RepID=UPI00217C0732|nr:fimbria/pilus outer membrane usher protein [Serratia ficaria]CAI1507047.1 F1 capsule-anchoring protein precursor [Serratia ficaria]
MSAKKYGISPVLVIGAVFCTLSSSVAVAGAWSFDPAQLSDAGQNVDISVFNEGSQLPGIYPVDILLNGERVDSREMVFHQEQNAAGKPFLKTCLTRAMLERYGVKTEAYPGIFPVAEGREADAQQCATLTAIPQARETFNFYQQQLLLSIPQAALRPKLSGIAPQELWDDGIPAALMNYRTNITRSESRGFGAAVNESRYVQLEPGANLGAWRLRNLTTWQKQGHTAGKWQTAWTYAERGLYDLKSRLTLGDRYTPSDVFDGIPFRGVMLGSDDAMVPWSQRGFAPVVRGIARTQARVEVMRNGYVIYSMTVAPGPFALTDLPSASAGEDLHVTVYETDGQQQQFIVPSSTPAIALREGYLKYNLMSGRYRPSAGGISEATVGQASVMYGLPWGITAYGGLQGAEHYRAASLGLGVSLNALGAVSVDGIQEQGKKRGMDMTSGHSWRLRYSKNFEATNTGISLASYRYASSGFNGLAGVLDSYQSGTWGGTSDVQQRQRKSRSSLTLSQSVGKLGSLSLTGAREDYWHQQAHRDELMASWGSSFRNVSWSLNWAQRQSPVYSGHSHGAGRHTDRELSFWLSMPLDSLLGGNTRSSYQMVSATGRDTQHEFGLNGEGFDRQLSWDIRERLTPGSRFADRNRSLLNLAWHGAYGELRGGYSYGPSNRQMNAGLAGGLLAHRHGITLGQPLGDTVALVEAPGASGVATSGVPGVKTDFRGYTTLGYVTPYQENTVTLDPVTLSADVELPQTDTRVVPTAGAVIPARFATRTGGRAVITLTQKDGHPLPFGALVTLSAEGKNNAGAGITGEGGEVYMSGLPATGVLQVATGNGPACQADYRLPQEKGPAGVYALRAVCR